MMPIMNTKPKSFGLTIQRFQLTEKLLIYHKAKSTIGVLNNYATNNIYQQASRLVTQTQTCQEYS